MARNRPPTSHLGEIEKDLTCERCSRPAVVNVQLCWVYWTYDAETGKYGECDHRSHFKDHPFDPEQCRHFCADHLNDWEHGEFL